MYFVRFCTGLPILALIFTLYAMYVQLGLVDSTPGVIFFMVAAALPFNTWIMKNNYDWVSIDLEEADWIDGCSTLGSFLRILLPLCDPSIGVVGILIFVNAYTNFFVPFIIYTSASKCPASVQLFSFFRSYGPVNYGQIAAFSMLRALPAIVFYAVTSRFLAKGIDSSGVKG